MNWKVGDIAIVCNSWQGFPDSECEIIELPTSFCESYRVVVGQMPWNAQYDQLKPLPPHEEPGSWEELKDIFNPFVVTVDA